MKKLSLLLAALCLLKLSFSQNLPVSNDMPSNPIVINYDRGLSTEMNYQGKYGFAIGGIIGKNLGHKSNPNFSCAMYTDLILSDSLIFGPRLKLNWNYLNFFGVSLNFANNYRSGQNDVRITPEINFSVNGLANVFAGYSFIVSKTQFTDLSVYKVGINLNILH
jgi:hypothetical protein